MRPTRWHRWGGPGASLGGEPSTRLAAPRSDLLAPGGAVAPFAAALALPAGLAGAFISRAGEPRAGGPGPALPALVGGSGRAVGRWPLHSPGRPVRHGLPLAPARSLVARPGVEPGVAPAQPPARRRRPGEQLHRTGAPGGLRSPGSARRHPGPAATSDRRPESLCQRPIAKRRQRRTSWRRKRPIS